MKEFQFEYITKFINDFYTLHDGELGALEKEAREEGLPVAKRDTIALLEILCKLKAPKRILEVGTCVGFSALVMSSVCPNAHIDTIDRYKYMIDRAKVNFEKFHADNITLNEGQASDILPKLTGKYDLIYLDAAKGQYPNFLPYLIDLLENDGLFVADNILCGGIVAGAPLDSRRDKTIVNRMNSFIEMIKNDGRLQKALLPCGDGIMIFIKKADAK